MVVVEVVVLLAGDDDYDDDSAKESCFAFFSLLADGDWLLSNDGDSSGS